MKTFVRHAVMLLAATAMCQAGIARAESFNWLSGDLKAVDLQPSGVSCDLASCNEPSCVDETCYTAMGCDGYPSRGIVGFAGLDSFKGISDGSFQSNFGVLGGVNAAIPVPGLSDYGIGWQLGLSYGVYDFDGWGSSTVNRVSSQQQTFVTTGFYRKADNGQQLSFGIVYDWMFNDNWGVYGVNPTLGQWRGQIEYALSGSNAIGVWGCVGDLYSQQLSAGQVVVRNAGVNQANLFWHHKFATGADSWLWIGVPERYSLTGVGSLGDWMVGANVQVPLSDRLALYANGSYFHPTASAGPDAAMTSGYDVSMGVMWYFGRHADSQSINGACWLPYMPMGNNSNFLVDQNSTF